MRISLNNKFTTPNGRLVIVSGLGKGMVTLSTPNAGTVRRAYPLLLTDIVTGVLKVA